MTKVKYEYYYYDQAFIKRYDFDGREYESEIELWKVTRPGWDAVAYCNSEEKAKALAHILNLVS